LTSGFVLIMPAIRSTADFIAVWVGVEPPSSVAGNAASSAAALSSAGATWISCGHMPIAFDSRYMPAHSGDIDPPCAVAATSRSIVPS
jgi:hypothetical protein